MLKFGFVCRKAYFRLSFLAMNNTNPKVIKELARHSDLKITSEHYLADNTMNKSIMEHWADENRNID